MFDQTKNKIELNRQFEEAVMKKDIEKIRSLFSEDKDEVDKPYLNYEMLTAPGIMVAAQNGAWDIVEELYNLGADLDVKIMPYRWYLLHECIANAPDRVTKAIIQESNINTQTTKGETPLMIAISREKGIIAEYLVETGRVDMILTNNNNENVAHYAARAKNYDLFIKLVAKGVSLLKKNKEGKTPIDLIEDDTFRLSLPTEFEKMAIVEKTDVKQDIEEKISELDTSIPVKKVSGLSSIKRK
jgi:hypothetical protein